MKHCVSSYYSICVEQNFAILHLEGDDEHSTVQLDFKYDVCRIVQHKGIKNANPCASHLQMVDKICNAFNEKLKRRGNLTRLKNGFRKHRQAIGGFYEKHAVDLNRPLTDKQWEQFFELFDGFVVLPKLKKAMNTV